MDQPDVYSQNKNMLERATAMSSNKSASKNQVGAGYLLRSNLGFSEPTNLPTAELSSTQSVRDPSLLERKQASGYKKASITPNRISPASQAARKRYFSIFESSAGKGKGESII